MGPFSHGSSSSHKRFLVTFEGLDCFGIPAPVPKPTAEKIPVSPVWSLESFSGMGKLRLYTELFFFAWISACSGLVSTSVKARFKDEPGFRTDPSSKDLQTLRKLLLGFVRLFLHDGLSGVFPGVTQRSESLKGSLLPAKFSSFTFLQSGSTERCLFTDSDVESGL